MSHQMLTSHTSARISLNVLIGFREITWQKRKVEMQGICDQNVIGIEI
jgi:hypothetical protein